MEKHCCWVGLRALGRLREAGPPMEAGLDMWVKLENWKGVVARVDVNGVRAGYIGWRPWELDVSKWIQPGVNSITVEVYGSLKNLLGPHHQGKVRGSAWPGHFLHNTGKGQPRGDAYDVMEYGLNEPFQVIGLERD